MSEVNTQKPDPQQRDFFQSAPTPTHKTAQLMSQLVDELVKETNLSLEPAQHMQRQLVQKLKAAEDLLTQAEQIRDDLTDRHQVSQREQAEASSLMSALRRIFEKVEFQALELEEEILSKIKADRQDIVQSKNGAAQALAATQQHCENAKKHTRHLAALKEEMAAMHEQVAHCNTTAQSMKSNFSALEQELSGRRTFIHTTQQEIKTLAQAFKEDIQNCDVAELTAPLTRLKERAQSDFEVLEEIVAQSMTQAQSLEDLETQSQQTASDLGQKVQEMASLTDQGRQELEKLKAMRLVEQAEEALAQTTEAQLNIQQTMEETQRTQHRMQELKQSAESIRHLMEEYQTQFEACSLKMSETMSQVENSNVLKRCETLQNQTQEEWEKAKEAREEAEVLQTRMMLSQKELDMEKDEAATLKRNMEKLYQELDEIKKKHESYKPEIDFAAITAESQEAHHMMEDIKSMRNETLRLKQESQEDRKAAAAIREEAEQMKIQVSTLIDEFTNLKNKGESAVTTAFRKLNLAQEYAREVEEAAIAVKKVQAKQSSKKSDGNTGFFRAG